MRAFEVLVRWLEDEVGQLTADYPYTASELNTGAVTCGLAG
jgi:hypothetical protein